MKSSVCLDFGVLVFGVLLSIYGIVEGQEAVFEQDTEIIGGPATGEPAPVKTQEPKSRPIYQICKTLKKNKNGRQIAIHEVAPLVASPQNTAKATASVSSPRVAQAKYDQLEPLRMIFLSASVYGTSHKKLTKLTLFHGGKHCVAWSNIDFHHLDGFPAFRVENREYMQLMSVYDARKGDGGTKSLADTAADGCPMAGRRLSFRSAAFVITEIESGDQHSKRILADIHHLYRKQKLALKSAYEQRKRNAQLNKMKKARRSNESPPPPKPITIHFWKRDVVKERENRPSDKDIERRAK